MLHSIQILFKPKGLHFIDCFACGFTPNYRPWINLFIFNQNDPCIEIISFALYTQYDSRLLKPLYKFLESGFT